MDSIFLLSLALMMSLGMAITWAIKQTRKVSGHIDAAWSFLVGVGGLFSLFYPLPNGAGALVPLATAMIILWSWRLGAYLGARGLRFGNDPRYSALDQDWGAKAPLYGFIFLQIQALCAFILALGYRAIALRAEVIPNLKDYAAIAIFLVGLWGESVADGQLKRFKSDPNNHQKVCDIGLWGLSRHPNYFFEWLVWCGVALLAFDGANPLSGWVFALPAMMYYLLVYASGIPPLERHMLATRPDAYRAYQARVGAFFPRLSFRIGPKAHNREVS